MPDIEIRPEAQSLAGEFCAQIKDGIRTPTCEARILRIGGSKYQRAMIETMSELSRAHVNLDRGFETALYGRIFADKRRFLAIQINAAMTDNEAARQDG